MATQLGISDQDGRICIGLSDAPNDYLMWQFIPQEQGQIYFEYDDQVNGGYDIATEITVMHDGIHILLASGKLIHFYFDGFSKSKYDDLVQALQRIYHQNQSVLEVLD